jgi:hypothetical protein
MANLTCKYNDPGSPISGAQQKANLAFATEPNFPFDGTWYGGVEDSDGYVIVSDSYSMGWTSEADSKPTFWKCAYNDTDLLSLINQLPERDIQNGGYHFNNISDARTWLEGTGKYALLPLTFLGTTGKWILADGQFGCQPAWDPGVMNVINWNIACGGVNDIASAVNGGYFAIYINGLDSAGNDKSSFLTSVIGVPGTITFSQGSSYVTLGFSSDTWGPNNFGYATGIFFDEEGSHGTPPTVIASSGTFMGVDLGDPNGPPPSYETVTDHDLVTISIVV